MIHIFRFSNGYLSVYDLEDEGSVRSIAAQYPEMIFFVAEVTP